MKTIADPKKLSNERKVSAILRVLFIIDNLKIKAIFFSLTN